MLRKLDIVVMLVKDWPAAVRWYTEKLGLKLLYKEDDDRWCQLAFPDGGTTLALYGADTVDPSARNRCLPDILVDDLSATVEELRRRGVEFRGDIRGGDEGYRIATLIDLEGNELQLYEWIRPENS
jgi:catechol 2,3-dioxygenase-like lactoylglutathione lyase family enzyme